MNNYTPEDMARMKYYLAEMEDKFQTHPNSICLKNGIAEIRKRLGLPTTVTPIDPMVELDGLTVLATDKVTIENQLQGFELDKLIKKQFGMD